MWSIETQVDAARAPYQASRVFADVRASLTWVSMPYSRTSTQLGVSMAVYVWCYCISWASADAPGALPWVCLLGPAAGVY